ncbi:MAG: hypothetical protein Q7T33_10880 [Dehalococcoidia bacterium]|nr:hypothetical protein [Dehalococcoidia bacterium]
MERRLLIPVGALLGLLSFILVLGAADTAHAGTFNPVLRFCFDDITTVDPNPTKPGDSGECDGDNSAGAASTFATGFDLPTGDVNFGGIVAYISSDWNLTLGDEFPVGTKVGRVESLATIGIIGAQCDNKLNLVGTAGFEMFNSSIDINDTIEFDEESAGDTTKEDWAEDLDKDGLKDFVTKYPAFISRVIKDQNDKPQQPLRRSAGHLVIAGADVLLQYLVYEPGTFINKNLQNDPELGYPTVTLLQNIGDPDLVPEPGPITDFCSPLQATVTSLGTGDACDSVVNDDEGDDELINDGCPALGTSETEAKPFDGSDPCANNTDDDLLDDLDSSRTAGHGEVALVNDGCPKAGDKSEADISYTLYRNPDKEGTLTFTTVAVAQSDPDGDGLETSLDTCPLVANVGDPRIKEDGDADGDGLDAACDPNDQETNSDEDLDGYLNRQDNCPIKANGDQTTNQADDDVDEDGDDQRDGIGNECDPDPLVFNGEPLAERLKTLTIDVEIGPPAPGQTPSPGATPPADNGDGDDGGSSSTIIIIIAVIAAVVVLGGGAFYFMRRGGGAPSA